MEWEQSTKYTETDEYQWEEDVLNILWHSMHTSQLYHIHCGCTTEVVDTEDTKYQKCRTTHQHQRKLHRRILLWTSTPYSDEEVHWNKCYLIEHEHSKHIRGDEEAKYT